MNMVSDGVVYQDYASCKSGWVATNPAAGQWSAIGCLIKQPREDATGYRIKARCNKDGYTYLTVGFAPLAPDGNDTINKVHSFPFRYEFDDVLLIPYEDEQSAYSGRPIAIGIAVGQNASGETESYLSVQNMSLPSPQFSASMS